MASARHRLRDAGIPADEASLDARLLAQHVLGWDAAALLSSGQTPAPDSFTERYQTVLARRVTREPLAYITGRKDFWNLTIEVSPAVLIPRPETELVVQAALERLPNGTRSQVADVCTGSGNIAVALATERSLAQIVATDISQQALGVAESNAKRYGVGDRIELYRADLLSGVSALFDVIVSNPPYVPLGDRAGLQPEVHRFEPALALFAGDDGLEVIEGLVAHAALRLKPGGFLIVEFGAGQDAAVSELISNNPRLNTVAIRLDLQGIPRVAIARAVSREP